MQANKYLWKKMAVASPLVKKTAAYHFLFLNLKLKKRATAAGGVFFKCKNADAQKEWHDKHLGIVMDKYGTGFEWRQSASREKRIYSPEPFQQYHRLFGDASQQYMINYHVENLEALVETLKNEGVAIVDTIENYEYGKFVHILDGEGNRVELWEANNDEYENMPNAVTK
jgi:hypothetical protein